MHAGGLLPQIDRGDAPSGEAVGGEDAVEAQDRDAHVEQSLAGSVERDVHPLTIGELPDRCPEILDFIAHQHPPGPGVAAERALCDFDTVAITRAPRRVANCVSMRPTPLPAEWTSTTASVATGTASEQRCWAVIPCIRPPAAASKLTPSGLGMSRSLVAATSSA